MNAGACGNICFKQWKKTLYILLVSVFLTGEEVPFYYDVLQCVLS